MNASTAFALVKTIQSNVPALRARLVERRVVVGRHDADHRRLDRLGAQRLEPLDELGRLLARPRHQDALAEERPRVEPAQVLAQRRRRGRRRGSPGAGRSIARRVARSSSSVPTMRLLRRQRAVVDDARPSPRAGRPCETSDVEDVRQLIGTGVADDRAVELRQARPVDRRRASCPRPRGRGRTSACRRRPDR